MKIRMSARAASYFLATVFMLACLSFFTFAESGQAYLDLSFVKKNEAGEGYSWNNRENVLTIEGLDISTSLPYGLRLPENCTVVVNGKNRIKANKFGIGMFSGATFKGDGELTVEAGDSAVYVYSGNSNHKLLIRGGTYSLSGDRYGIYSTNASVSVTEGSVEINAGERAISAPTLSLVGGKISANAPLYAGHRLDVTGAELDVRADESALQSDGSLSIDQVKIFINDDKDSKEAYGGENSIRTIPELADRRGSVIFGSGVSGAYDWLTLAGAIVLIAAVVVIPLTRKKIKTKRLYERLSESNGLSYDKIAKKKD